MIRPFLAGVPAVLLMLSSAAAWAQDVGAPVTSADTAAVTAIVRELGPFGAMAWGAWLLSGAVRALTTAFAGGVPVRVELSPKDRELLESIATRRVIRAAS